MQTVRLQFPDSGPFEFTRGTQGINFSIWTTTDQDAIDAMTAATAISQTFIIAVAQTYRGHNNRSRSKRR